MSYQEIKYKKLRWIDIAKPTAHDLQKLWKEFDFHALTLEDVKQDTQRSKVDVYDGKYYFLILLMPIFDARSNEIIPSEVNIYVGKHFLITIHRGNIPPLKKIFEKTKKDRAWVHTYMDNRRPTHLLYEYLETALRYCFPMLDEINNKLEKLEHDIFLDGRRNIIQAILAQRRNIVDLRKILQPHKATLTRLMAADEKHKILDIKKNFEYFDNLVDYTAEMWDSLQEYKESAEMLHQANDAIISTRINRVMKRLTLISVIFLPISLLAGIFGMNSKNIPFIGHPLDFWIVMSIMLTVGIFTIIIFKVQDWLD